MATLKFHSTRSRKTRRRFHADNTALIIVVGARDKNYTPLSHLVGRHRQVFEFTLPNPRGEYTRVEPRRVWAPGYAYAYIRTQWHNKYDVHVERLGLTVWDPERGERADENIIAKSFIRHRAARVYVNYVRTGRMRGWSRESSHRYRIYIYTYIYTRAPWERELRMYASIPRNHRIPGTESRDARSDALLSVISADREEATRYGARRVV